MLVWGFVFFNVQRRRKEEKKKKKKKKGYAPLPSGICPVEHRGWQFDG